MKIRVTDWQYRNLRGIGVGDQSIKLGVPPKRWSLIQMPNGTGKTTTMELIRAVLSEKRFTPEEVRGFRANDEVTDGSFELGLLINDKQYRLTLTFYFDSGNFSYSTSRTKERGGGQEPGRALPLPLKLRLKRNFTRLFVFDGELAKEIRAVDGAEADRAIKALYQLDDLGALVLRVEKVVRKHQDAAASVSHAKSTKGLSQRRNALNKANEVLSALEKELSGLKTRKSKLEKEENKANAKISTYIAENGDLKAEEKKIDSAAEINRSALQSAVYDAMNSFRSPVRLSLTILTRLNDLGKTLTDARLPKSVSSEFFSELAKKEVCICARPIGDAERAAIHQRKEDYLAKDQIAAISTMKKELKNSSWEPETSFQSACDELGTQVEARKINEGERDKLIQALADADNGEVATLRIRLGKIDTDLTNLRTKIEKLETDKIPLAKKRRDECREKFEVASKSYRLARQRDVLVRQISKIEERALKALRGTILEETNERLASLVQMEKLRVAKIEGVLTLTSDLVTERKGVSEGQSLSVAYAFLTSLLSKAPFELPFIVDSPAVSLDLDARREVGRIIPGLFDQMVMFVLTSEQAGFSETFYERGNTCFVSLSKAPGGGILREYGLAAFKRLAEEAPAS